MSEGIKYDSGKPRWSLLLPGFLESMAKILTYGAKTYGDYNWQLVTPTERYLDALHRHACAAVESDQDDPDTHQSHWAHVAVNAMFLWYFSRKNK